MKPLYMPLFIILSCSAAGVWLLLDRGNDPQELGFYADGQNNASRNSVLLEEDIAAMETQDTFLAGAQDIMPGGSTEYTPSRDVLVEDNEVQITSIIDRVNHNLRFDDETSNLNLMLLRDAVSRFNELSISRDEKNRILNLIHSWPKYLRESFSRLLEADRAEMELRAGGSQLQTNNPSAFRVQLLDRRKNILGDELFQRLYAEDQMQFNGDGLHANFSSNEEKVLLGSIQHTDTMALLAAWKQGEISESKLTDSLSGVLSNEEIVQLVDMGRNQEEWLAKLSHFLDEYQYIEQAGLVGHDEAQSRRELIERHFTSENHFVVNQLLFRASP